VYASQSLLATYRLEAGRFADAEAFFRGELLAKPDEADVAQCLAQCLAGQGKKKEAAELLRRYGI
jgi:predicted Zn-dependent protease